MLPRNPVLLYGGAGLVPTSRLTLMSESQGVGAAICGTADAHAAAFMRQNSSAMIAITQFPQWFCCRIQVLAMVLH
jgi:hypothetical protein